jgi:hypothetical protein
VPSPAPTTARGLAALIEGTPGYRCAGRYGSVEELLRKPPDRPANVYDKLHVHSKSEAVSKALRSGLIV